jgi:hypothetical protein
MSTRNGGDRRKRGMRPTGGAAEDVCGRGRDAVRDNAAACLAGSPP